MISYHKKNKILKLGAIIFFLLMMRLAFYPTWVQYKSNMKVGEMIVLSANIPGQRKSLEWKEKLIEKSVLPSSDTSAQVYLLNMISQYCLQSNIVLNEYPKSIKYEKNEYAVETNIFRLQGPYIPLLKMIYQLENERNSKIVSVNFELKNNYSLRKNLLTASIYIQNFRKTPNI